MGRHSNGRRDRHQVGSISTRCRTHQLGITFEVAFEQGIPEERMVGVAAWLTQLGVLAGHGHSVVPVTCCDHDGLEITGGDR